MYCILSNTCNSITNGLLYISAVVFHRYPLYLFQRSTEHIENLATSLPSDLRKIITSGSDTMSMR